MRRPILIALGLAVFYLLIFSAVACGTANPGSTVKIPTRTPGVVATAPASPTASSSPVAC